MATDSQGLQVAWGGNTLGEIVSLSLDGVASDAVEVTARNDTDRYKKWSAADCDAGSLSITLRTLDSLYVSSVGTTATLSISAGEPPTTLWNLGTPVMESLAWSASVGELQEYRVVFKLSNVAD